MKNKDLLYFYLYIDLKIIFKIEKKLNNKIKGILFKFFRNIMIYNLNIINLQNMHYNYIYKKQEEVYI